MEAGTSDPGGVERHCPSNGVRKATAHQETQWAWTELQGISLQHKEKKKILFYYEGVHPLEQAAKRCLCSLHPWKC